MAAEKPIQYDRGAGHDPKNLMFKPDEENVVVLKYYESDSKNFDNNKALASVAEV